MKRIDAVTIYKTVYQFFSSLLIVMSRSLYDMLAYGGGNSCS